MKINKILPEKSLNNLWIKIKELTQKVEECFQSVSNGKNLIASAITDKKVTTDATATFAEMAANIESLKLGSGNATIGDVLKGKTFTNSDGIEYTGTMPNINAIDDAIASNYVTNGSSGTGIYARMNTGAHVTLASSGHAELFIPQTQIATMFSANATAAQILKDKTAWVNGKKITGTMTNQGAKTASLNCGKSYTIPAGYHNGSGKVTANNLASQTDGTATAAKIASGYTAYVDGKKITGTAKLAPTKLTGSVKLTDANSGGLDGQKSVSKQITFSTPFGSVPTVSATATCSVSHAQGTLSKTISNITKGGFSVTVKNGQAFNGYNAGTITLTWVATD